MLRDSYLLAVVCINGYFLAVVISNIVYLRRATLAPRIKRGPFVSVIVPARNEAHSIARCVESLLAQDYADYEVIVVDDESTDGTAAIIASLAARDPRLRVVTGAPLCEGWLGKPHALSQGTAAARGEILLLADADTVHEPSSLSWAVTNLVDHHADVLSGYVSQEYGSLGESIVVPTMYAMMMLVPFFLLPRTRSPRFAFSIGQYVVLRRAALDAVGGFEAIKDTITDDMSMATRMKEFGFRNVFLDAKDVARCHLYDGYSSAYEGIERSIYSAVGGHPLATLAITALVLGVIVWPAVSVLLAIVHLQVPTGPLALSAAIFTAQWALLAWDRNVPPVAFVLYPLVFLDLAIILNASMFGTGFGPGVDWKGRIVRMPREGRAARRARMADLASRSGEAR